jgi:hypothetical protein
MNVAARDLEEAVLAAIKKQAEVVLGADDLTAFRKPGADARQIAEYEKCAAELSQRRQDCYEQFMRGEIDRDAFMAMKSEYTAQIDGHNAQAALFRQIGRAGEAQIKTAALAKEALSETATPKDVVDALIEKIHVFPGNRLEIHWKFADFTENNDTEDR